MSQILDLNRFELGSYTDDRFRPHRNPSAPALSKALCLRLFSNHSNNVFPVDWNLIFKFSAFANTTYLQQPVEWEILESGLTFDLKLDSIGHIKQLDSSYNTWPVIKSCLAGCLNTRKYNCCDETFQDITYNIRLKRVRLFHLINMDMALYTKDHPGPWSFWRLMICKCIRVTFFIMLLVLIPSWYNQKYVFESCPIDI